MAVAVSVLSPRSVTEWDRVVKYYTQGGWLKGFIAAMRKRDDDQARRLVAAVEAFTWHLWPGMICSQPRAITRQELGMKDRTMYGPY